MDEFTYKGFLFSNYLIDYIEKNGITRAYIGRLLGISYATLRTKFDRNSFTYSEVLYLDTFYSDLKFVENYKKYLDVNGLLG